MAKNDNRPAYDAGVAQELVDQLLGAEKAPTIYLFERASTGETSVSLKTGYKGGGITVSLSGMTPEKARGIGEAVSQVLQYLCSPEGAEYVKAHTKRWDDK